MTVGSSIIAGTSRPSAGGSVRWYDPLIALLCEQPAQTPTVTLPLWTIERLAAPHELAPGAWTRTYWTSARTSGVRSALTAAGWRPVRFDRDARTVSFARAGLRPAPPNSE
jgi:hypothetical protein